MFPAPPLPVIPNRIFAGLTGPGASAPTFVAHAEYLLSKLARKEL
jgi:hypothetical protein